MSRRPRRQRFGPEIIESRAQANFTDIISPSGEGDPISSKIIRLHPPLNMAALEAQSVVLKQLIDRGVNANDVDPDTGRTALRFAAAKICIIAIKILLDAGYDQNHRDRGGETPLLHAVSGTSAILEISHHNSGLEDDTAVVLYSISHSKTANTQDRNETTVNAADPISGATVLHYVAARGSVAMIEALLDAGCYKEQFMVWLANELRS